MMRAGDMKVRKDFSPLLPPPIEEAQLGEVKEPSPEQLVNGCDNG